MDKLVDPQIPVPTGDYWEAQVLPGHPPCYLRAGFPAGSLTVLRPHKPLPLAPNRSSVPWEEREPKDRSR
jgi:hypothetical protein